MFVGSPYELLWYHLSLTSQESEVSVSFQENISIDELFEKLELIVKAVGFSEQQWQGIICDLADNYNAAPLDRMDPDVAPGFTTRHCPTCHKPTWENYS